MIALTQEKREELISCCNREIEHLNKLLSMENCSEELAVKLNFEILRNEILIYTLTARPAAEIKCLEDLTLEVVNVSDGFNLGRHPVFTAPPVPEIKLVEHKQINDVYHGASGTFNAGKSAGWNECLAEVKRLNGWGE